MFYVYVYYNPITLIPFYVGKGKDSRMYYHLWNVNSLSNTSLQSMILEIRNNNQQPIIEKVFITDNETEALDVERQLIAQHGRIDLNTGTLCNKTPGGDGFGNTGTRWSTDQRKKLTEYRQHHVKGRGISQYDMMGNFIVSYKYPKMLLEHFSKTDLMAIRLCCRGKRFSVKGYRWSYEGDELCGANKGVVVRQTSLDGTIIQTFATIGIASKHTGINAGDIATCVRGERCTAGGYIWTSDNTKQKKNLKNKKVCQLSIDGKLIATFPSISTAAKSVGIDPANIRQVCTGNRKTSAGFIWKYKEVSS